MSLVPFSPMAGDVGKAPRDLDGLQTTTRILVWLVLLFVASWWVASILLVLTWPGDVAMYAGISPWPSAPIGLGAVVLAFFSSFAVQRATSSASRHWKRILLAVSASVAYVGVFAAFLVTPLDQSSSAYLAVVPFGLAFPFFTVTAGIVLFSLVRVSRERRQVPQRAEDTSPLRQ